MDEILFRTVLVRVMIEHRLVRPWKSMAQAISEVAGVSGLTPRYVNMVLMGDKRSVNALDCIEDALTTICDAEGGVPAMCCTPGGADAMRNLSYEWGGEM